MQIRDIPTTGDLCTVTRGGWYSEIENIRGGSFTRIWLEKGTKLLFHSQWNTYSGYFITVSGQYMHIDYDCVYRLEDE
jgi:hypothetical protein